MRAFIIAIVVLMTFGTTTSTPSHADNDRVSLSGGVFAFDEDGDKAAEARLAYLSGWRLLDKEFGRRFRGIGPYVALSANSDGGVFGSGGLFLDAQPFPRTYLRLFAGVGGYSERNGRDLGGVFQFETGGALGYRFQNQVETGILFRHISNAGIHDSNPGANSLMLTVSIPLRILPTAAR